MPTAQNSYTNQRRNSSKALVPYDGQRPYGSTPNWTMPGTPSDPLMSSQGFYAGNSNSFKNLFSKLKSKFNATGGKGSLSSLTNPDNYAWNKGSGIQAFGKNLGKGANIIGGIVQGANALQGLGDYNSAESANEDLINDIEVSALGNPLLSSYLTSDQLNLLGDVRQGRYDSGADFGDFSEGMGQGLPQAIPSAILGFATGGIPGAIIGGVGSLLNSGINGMNEVAVQNSAELQALYQALQDAEMQYKSMRRPNFTGLGIQQQYQNMYM